MSFSYLTTVAKTLVRQTTQALMRTTGLGATTVGSNLFTLTNPGAITFLRINADNTVTALTQAQARTALGMDATFITPITGGSQAESAGVMTDVTGSAMTLGVGMYYFEWSVVHNSAATTTGAFFTVATGGGLVQNYLRFTTIYDVQTTDKSTTNSFTSNGGVTSTSSRSNSAVNRDVIFGRINVTTGGTITLRFSTEINASAITIVDLSGFSQQA